MAITISGNAATTRTNLGLGTAATLTAGTSANNIVQLNSDGNIPALDGSALTNLNSSGIQQIVNNYSTSAYSISNNSYLEDSALTGTITPTSTSSKILIHLTDGVQLQSASQAFYQKIGRTIGGGSETNISGDLKYESSATQFRMLGWWFVDAPATTSAVVYKRYFYTQSSNGQLSMNSFARTMTLMEIK